MRKNVISLAAIAILILFSTVSFAEEKHQHEMLETKSEALSLPPDLKPVLLKEMKAIKNGMEKMIGEMAFGNYDNVAEIAGKIEKSFILKQKLSNEQLKKLHGLLPPGFRELDAKFHKNAGMLSHVAKAGHIDLVSFYYYKLLEGCQECHGKYAQKRFPGFKGESAHIHDEEH